MPPTLQFHTPVMCKVALDEMSGRQCREQREFPGKNGSTGNPGQLSSILTRVVVVRPMDTQHLQWEGGGGSVHKMRFTS